MLKTNLIRIRQGLLFLLPILYLIVLRMVLGESFSLPSLMLGTVFTISVLLVAPWLMVERVGGRSGKVNLIWPVLIVTCIASTAFSALTDNQVTAWIGLVACFILTLGIHKNFCCKPFTFRWWIFTAILGGIFSLLPILFNQILTRFSEEEFFTAVQGGFFFIYWLLMAFVNMGNAKILKIPSGPWLTINLRILFGTACLLLILFGWLVIKSYQASFYTQEAQVFPGISNETPFLCGTAGPEEKTTAGSTFFQDYIQKISANPNLEAPDQGLLFLASGDMKWASAFHASLLKEASQNLYTKPANSVKFDQYLASLRVYAYARVRTRLPALFSKEEQSVIENWFHAINRRAMTVEWVDWMYGLAFSMKPEGPYENQENGAGLIALLESEKLADPNLSQQNRDYLDRHQRGWQQRFRNTDDSINYQSEWITNAYFQQIYEGKAPAQNIRNSFEWMFFQMLPDGRAPQYNLPMSYTLTGSMYLGANLLQDGRFLWLADKSLHATGNDQFPLSFQAGTEQTVELKETRPTQGSCLLYGDSGLPTQEGPLTPDKVVFRDGWSDYDNYLLLNLRFMGWHRYKGTNTITLFDKGGPLINEQIFGAELPWLPQGRSAFRDKRIPRENLNGLQIQRQGLDAVLYQLLGYGGPWAQDPPFTAQVDEFSTSSEMDVSQTRISNWHGWSQSRKIYFVHNGIIVVVDEANGPGTESAAITWNLVNSQNSAEGRFLMVGNSQKAELILLNHENGKINVSQGSGQGEENTEQILFNGPNNGHFRLVSVLLTGDWLGAQAKLSETGGKENLEIQQAGKVFELNLDTREIK